MSAAGGRCGVGGGRTGGGADGGAGGGRGGDDDAWIRSVGAKCRAAQKWTNWDLRPPPSLRVYAPGGACYSEIPVQAEPPRRANVGEGSSSGAAELLFARSDEEELAAVAEDVAASEALLADELEDERQEMARAIAEVEAFKAREAEARAAVVFIDYADE